MILFLPYKVLLHKNSDIIFDFKIMSIEFEDE